MGTINSFPITTAELASVTADTSVDTLLGTTNGALKQIQPSDIPYDNTNSGLAATTLSDAIDEVVADVEANDTVDTTSFTENGITFNLSKRNGVITITASSGSLTNAVGDGDTVATIPSGYRPTHTLQVWEVANSRRMAITSAGVISMVSAITSGSYIRFTVTYVGG